MDGKGQLGSLGRVADACIQPSEFAREESERKKSKWEMESERERERERERESETGERSPPRAAPPHYRTSENYS